MSHSHSLQVLVYEVQAVHDLCRQNYYLYAQLSLQQSQAGNLSISDSSYIKDVQLLQSSGLSVDSFYIVVLPAQQCVSLGAELPFD